MKKIAVRGMNIAPVETGILIDGYVIVTPSSINVFVDNKGVYSGDVAVTVPAPTYGAFVAPSTTFVIHPSCEFCDVDGNPCLLEGDTSDTLTLTGTNPSGATTEFSLTLKVLSANQEPVATE